MAACPRSTVDRRCHSTGVGHRVTDAGLEHLEGMTTLKKISVHETPVTDAGEKKLQQALPHCKIEH